MKKIKNLLVTIGIVSILALTVVLTGSKMIESNTISKGDVRFDIEFVGLEQSGNEVLLYARIDSNATKYVVGKEIEVATDAEFKNCLKLMGESKEKGVTVYEFEAQEPVDVLYIKKPVFWVSGDVVNVSKTLPEIEETKFVRGTYADVSDLGSVSVKEEAWFDIIGIRKQAVELEFDNDERSVVTKAEADEIVIEIKAAGNSAYLPRFPRLTIDGVTYHGFLETGISNEGNFTDAKCIFRVPRGSDLSNSSFTIGETYERIGYVGIDTIKVSK